MVSQARVPLSRDFMSVHGEERCIICLERREQCDLFGVATKQRKLKKIAPFRRGSLHSYSNLFIPQSAVEGTTTLGSVSQETFPNKSPVLVFQHLLQDIKLIQ